MTARLGSFDPSALIVCVLFLTGVLSSEAWAAPPDDAFPLVAGALEAKHLLRYSGRQAIVIMPPTRAEVPPDGPTQIVSDVTRDGRRVRRVYWLPSDAARRIVVDDGRLHSQWEPARHLILVDRTHEETRVAGRRMLLLLHRNYRCLRLRRERVNALWCDVIAVRRRQGAGPSRLLWIERQRHAMLRTEEYDAAGQRRSQSFFETFRYVDRVPAKTFRLSQAARRRPAPRALQEVAGPWAAFTVSGVAGRSPAWLPPGYVLVGCAVSGGPSKAAVLRYGDGLTTLSVFEEAAHGGAEAPGRQALLEQEMARIGQRAWTCHLPSLRITIMGDATLPDGVGEDLTRALSPGSEARLARRLARDFRGVPQVQPLRRRQWGYEDIAALGIYLRAHPSRASAVALSLRHQEAWPQIAVALHADAARLDGGARRWIAAALAAP